MTFVRKSYTFQNQLKKRTLLPAEKFGNIISAACLRNIYFHNSVALSSSVYPFMIGKNLKINSF